MTLLNTYTLSIAPQPHKFQLNSKLSCIWLYLHYAESVFKSSGLGTMVLDKSTYFLKIKEIAQNIWN